MNPLALIFLIACSLLLTPVATVAQEPKASVEITPDTCLIGDNVFYLLSITHHETQIVLLPSDTDEVAFYPFEIRSRKKLFEEERDGLTTERWQYTLTVFDTGAQIIPPLDLRYVQIGKSDTTETVLKLDSKMIYVRSVLDTTVKDIADIKPLQTLPVPAWVYVVSAIALLLTLGGSYWLFKAWQKRRKAEKPKPVVPEKPPYQIAHEKLAALDAYPLDSQGDFKKFYSDLSDILREFIERYYGVPALEQITSEILYSLRTKLSSEQIERYRQVFERADLVKFAKFYPSKIEARESLSLSKAIIEDAMPKLEPSATASKL
ncbi:MAG: hypothetical protein ACK4XY_09925 [Chloroherpetonaceae bacterium]